MAGDSTAKGAALREAHLEPPEAACDLALRWVARAYRSGVEGPPHPETLRILAWTIHYARRLRVLNRRLGSHLPWKGFEVAVPVVSRSLQRLPHESELPEICGLTLRRLWIHPQGGIAMQHWPLPAPPAGVPPSVPRLHGEVRKALRPLIQFLIDSLAGGSERRILVAPLLLHGPSVNPELDAVAHLVALGGRGGDRRGFAFLEHLSPEARQDFEERIDPDRFRRLVARGIGRLFLGTATRVAREVRSIWGAELTAALGEVCLPHRLLLRYLSPTDPTLARYRCQAVHAFPDLPWNSLPDDAEWSDFREAVDGGRSPLPHFPDDMASLPPRKLLRAAGHFAAAGLASDGPPFLRQRDPWNQTATDRELTAAVIDGTPEAWWPDGDDWTGWAVLCALGPELGGAPRGAGYVSLRGLIDRPFPRVRAFLERYTGPWNELVVRDGLHAGAATARVVALLRQVARDLLPFLTNVRGRLEGELGVPLPVTADRDASLITWLRRSDAWHRATIDLTRERLDDWLAQPSPDFRFAGWPGLLDGGEATLTLDGTEIRVRELLDPLALAVEGSEMDHCLGTYAWRALRGNHRYVALESQNSVRSTLEISIDHGTWDPGYALDMGQHAGPGNSAPTDTHWRAAKQLLEVLKSDGDSLRERLREIGLAACDVDESATHGLPEAWNLDMAKFCASTPLGEIWRRFGRSLPGSLRGPLRAALGDLADDQPLP